MNTSPPGGWIESEYKSFKIYDNTSSDSESDIDEEPEPGPVKIKGYIKEKYKQILFLEELLPE